MRKEEALLSRADPGLRFLLPTPFPKWERGRHLYVTRYNCNGSLKSITAYSNFLMSRLLPSRRNNSPCNSITFPL